MTLTGRHLGRYRLDALLGQGGMAEVYRATDTRLDRVVAIKVIHGSHAGDALFLNRFEQEARLVARLEHPCILPLYDYGEHDGLPFLVMPYLDGGTLRERMLGQPVPFGLAATWLRQLGDALDAAHAAGVLHRDIKPANVLIGKGDRLMLADFGIAKMLESTTGLTATGMVVGTPVYMAPEQAQGKPATPASDRYALGVLAYELLSGRPPFDGESALALMNQHVTMAAPPLSTRVRGLPVGLDAVLERALAKDPAERHPSSRAFAEAVAAFLPTAEHPTAEVPTASWAPAGASMTNPTVVQRTPSPGARLPVSVTPAPRSLTSEATVAARRPTSASRRWALPAGAVLVAGAALAFVVVRERSQSAAPVVETPAPQPSAAPATAALVVPTAAVAATAVEAPAATPAPILVIEVSPTARPAEARPTPGLAAAPVPTIDVPPPPVADAPRGPAPPPPPEQERPEPPSPEGRSGLRGGELIKFVEGRFGADPAIGDLLSVRRLYREGRNDEAFSAALNAQRRATAGPVKFASAAVAAELAQEQGKRSEASRLYREAFSTPVSPDEMPGPMLGHLVGPFMRRAAEAAASYESAETGRPITPEELMDRACRQGNSLACPPPERGPRGPKPGRRRLGER